MNNAFLVFENQRIELEPDQRISLKEREGELVKIVDSLQKVQVSKEWSTLKIKVFDGLVESLNKEISSEAKRDNPDVLKLNRLTGQLKWAERFSDLKKLEDIFRSELTNIRIKYGQTEKPGSR